MGAHHIILLFAPSNALFLEGTQISLMGLFTFFKKKPDPRPQARRIYANALRLSGVAKAIRANKIVVALRATQVMDKIFEEGQRKVLAYDDALMVALAGGEDPPNYPQAEANDCFQEILTASGKAYAYVPFKYAQIMFMLGANHQSGRMSTDAVPEIARGVSDQIVEELKLSEYAVQPIDALTFLRDLPDSDTAN